MTSTNVVAYLSRRQPMVLLISHDVNQWCGRGNSDWCRIPRILCLKIGTNHASSLSHKKRVACSRHDIGEKLITTYYITSSHLLLHCWVGVKQQSLTLSLYYYISFSVTQPAWIGLTDREAETYLMWTNKQSVVNYNPVGTAPETDCITVDSAGSWSHYSCKEINYYVCQYSLRGNW